MKEMRLTYPRLQSALRQAVYLAIKELATTAEDVIMVTSSIMKDMQNNSEVIYKPNAIRALCKIIDVRGHPYVHAKYASDPHSRICSAIYGSRR